MNKILFIMTLILYCINMIVSIINHNFSAFAGWLCCILLLFIIKNMQDTIDFLQ